MALISKEARFFGLDLNAVFHEMGNAWRGLDRSWAFAWLTPPVPVQLLRADGSTQTYLGDLPLPTSTSASQGDAARFRAVALPEDLVLLKELMLPALSPADAANALALELSVASPFAPSDLAWGWSGTPAQADGMKVQAVMTSRKQVEQHLLSLNLQPQSVEVWYLPSGQVRPIVLQGFGEQGRVLVAKRQRLWGYLLLALASVLVFTLAASPLLQLRMRAAEAEDAYSVLQKQAEPALKKRESLIAAADRLNGVQELLAARVDPLRVMDLLTQLCPDDTVLQSIQVQGAKVSITGQTNNAAALMQKFSAEPSLKEVRAPAPATKPLGATKETFSIEFVLGPPDKTTLNSTEARAVRNTADPAEGVSASPSPASTSVAASVPAPVSSTAVVTAVPAPAAQTRASVSPMNPQNAAPPAAINSPGQPAPVPPPPTAAPAVPPPVSPHPAPNPPPGPQPAASGVGFGGMAHP